MQADLAQEGHLNTMCANANNPTPLPDPITAPFNLLDPTSPPLCPPFINMLDLPALAGLPMPTGTSGQVPKFLLACLVLSCRTVVYGAFAPVCANGMRTLPALALISIGP